MSELQGLQSRIEDFTRAGADVFAVCTDSVEQNAEVASSLGLDLRVLSDPNFEAIDAFGLRHVDGGFGHDIARPAIFLINEDGRITWRHMTDNWRVRVRPEQLLDELASAP